MHFQELGTAFQAANITLIEVENFDDADDYRSLRVAGNLANYISAANALHVPVVFVYLEELEVEDFLYRPGNDEADDDETQERDLCSVNLELKPFKKYLGEVGSFTLYAPLQPKGLTYLIENDWYTEFWKCRDSAAELVEQQYANSQASIDEEENKRLAAVTTRLNNLVNDEKFARLPTQKSMLAYARRNVAGVDAMDRGTLKEAISDIAAQIIAKGSE